MTVLAAAPIKLIDAYLQQLCHLSITKEADIAELLQKFIIDKALRNPNLGVKIYQLLQSSSEDVKSVNCERAYEFYN